MAWHVFYLLVNTQLQLHHAQNIKIQLTMCLFPLFHPYSSFVLCFYLYTYSFGFHIFFCLFFFIQIMCNRLVSVFLPSPSPLLSSLSLSSTAASKFLIYLVFFFATGVQSIEAFCDKHHWWQEQLGACIPCTVCEDGREQSIVLRPCQQHSDTICGTLEDVEVELDWLKEAAVAAEHRQVCYTLQFSLIKQMKKQKFTLCYFRFDSKAEQTVSMLFLLIEHKIFTIFFISNFCVYSERKSWALGCHWKSSHNHVDVGLAIAITGIGRIDVSAVFHCCCMYLLATRTLLEEIGTNGKAIQCR